MSKHILFVDDDPFVLDAIRRMLRTKQVDWDMAFAASGQEALAMMDRRRFDVVVSDMRMPGMDGNHLLREVMKRSPDTVRFILSGHSDQDLIYQSIGATHQYLAKPCSTRDLVNAVDRAFAIREMVKKRELRELVTRIQSIPSLPDLYVQVVEELKQPDPSSHRVGELISRDLGMSAKVLQLVNSAFFALPRQVGSPTQAVALLGIDVVKSLVLMVQVFHQMNGSPVQKSYMEGLWIHSWLVAHASLAIAKQAKGEKQEMDHAFMAGLFHDLGKLVLMGNLPEPYERALQLTRTQGLSGIEAERRALGGTHEEVGAYLLGLWGFSDPILEAAAFHHRPSECLCREYSSLTAVHVANVLVQPSPADGRRRDAPGLDPAYLEGAGVMESLPEWTRLCRDIVLLGVKGSEDGAMPR